MHTLICKRRPEIGSIVHTHGKAVMTMANLGWTLPPILTGLCEATGGAVLTSPYSQPETVQMADYTEPALRDRGATFLRFHGLLARRRPRARIPHSLGRRGRVRGVPDAASARRGARAARSSGRVDRLVLAGAVPRRARAAAHTGPAARPRVRTLLDERICHRRRRRLILPEGRARPR